MYLFVMSRTRLRLVVLALIITVLIVTSLGAGYFVGSQVTVRTTTSTSFISTTTTSMLTSTYTTTTTSMLTFTLTALQTVVTTTTKTILSNTSCANPVNWTPPNGFVLSVNSAAPSLLCVAYYYYSANSTFDLNPISQLRIFGWPLNRTGTYSTFNASSDFIVSSSALSFVLGGASSLNEGKEVTYSILAKPGVNGIFEVDVANLLPGMGCDPDFLLSAGTGVPNYSLPGGCYLVPYNNSTYPLTPGYLFVAWLGGTNSTS